MPSKLVIAVSQANKEPWVQIRKTQQETWINANKEKCLIIHYSSKNAIFLIKFLDHFLEKYRYRKTMGRIVSLLTAVLNKFISRNIPSYKFDIQDSELKVNSYSTYYLFGKRNLALYDWFIKNTTSEFLFQTNTSSYIRVEKILEITDQFDSNQDVYAGVIINNGSNSYPIVSGSGKLLSRSLIYKILQNRHQLNFNNLEDVCLADLIFDLGVEASNLPRIDIPSLEHLRSLKNKELCSNFHFRCKSGEKPRNDAEIMKQLTIKLSQVCIKTDKSDNSGI